MTVLYIDVTPGVAIVHLSYKGVRRQTSSTANEVLLYGKILYYRDQFSCVDSHIYS